MRAAAVLNDVNYCALALTILSERFTADSAINYISGKNGLKLTEADTTNMVMLKDQDGMTYKDIGQIYNMDKHAVYKRIARYKEKMI